MVYGVDVDTSATFRLTWRAGGSTEPPPPVGMQPGRNTIINTTVISFPGDDPKQQTRS